MTDSLTLTSLLSGALGALLVVAVQEIRRFYEQKCDDLIGTIVLVHQIQHNLAIFLTTGDILTEIRTKLHSSRISELSKFIRVPEIKGMSELRFNSLNLDKNITLKYSSLGCFYMIKRMFTSLLRCCYNCRKNEALLSSPP